MALSKQFITQALALVVGVFFVIICLFQNNGQGYIPQLDIYGYVTYRGKQQIELQGITFEADLTCNEATDGNSYKECQIFKATFRLAIVSILFGGLSLLFIILRQLESLNQVFQKWRIINIFILISIFVPVFIEIFMPMWKIIHSNDPDLTYKVGPIIQELISFIAFSCTFIIEALQLNKQTKIELFLP